MKDQTIFITYNPQSEAEQTLAVRLHTIGAVNGFRMYLPDRYNSTTFLDEETKRRIQESGFFVVFSLSRLSKIVKQEIEYAFQVLQDKSKILVIYNRHVGKNLIGEMTDYFTEIFFDSYQETVDTVIHKIFTTVFEKKNEELQNQITTEHTMRKKKELEKQQEQEKKLQNGFLAFVGIGLGLLVLNELFKK